MKIIGITGLKRSGKDTIAEYLIENYGFSRYSFADPIKRGAMEMFGFTEEQMWGDLKEVIDPRWGVTPRKMLQLIGTELFQYDIHKYMDTDNGEFNVGRGVWVHKFKLWVTENKVKVDNKWWEFWKTKKVNNIVLADVRFQHEVDAIEEMGGEIWKVVRPSLNNSDEHKSEVEMGLIVVDKIITNDGSLNDLHKKIDIIYS